MGAYARICISARAYACISQSEMNLDFVLRHFVNAYFTCGWTRTCACACAWACACACRVHVYAHAHVEHVVHVHAHAHVHV